MIGKAAPRLLATAALLAAALAPVPAAAQDGPDTGAVSAFVDRAFAAAVEAGDLRGAVVAVVRGGDLLHLGGYGVADEAGRPMRADDTGIRLGSASHVLTALVAVAAADEGIVGLQDDVRERLRGAGIVLDLAAPLTLHQLLTHTSGLGDRRLGLYRPEADRGSREALVAGRPPPVRLDGGQAVIESDLAMALAGAVLELASGEPLPALADRLLFRSAGLERTSFAAPNTADGPAAWATGYRWAGQRLRPMSSDEVPSTPAWEATGTAADMARLLAALLGGDASAADPAGFPGQARELLTTRQVTAYRPARGRSVALAERVVAGRTTWSHDGAAPGFTTHLAVVPDLDLGIFVAANSGATTGLWLPSATSRVVHGFPEALLQALWPDAVAPATELEVLAPDDRADYGGVYRDARIDPDTPLKVRGLIEQEPVAMLSDVRLRFRGQTYRKIALDTFQSEDDPARFARFLRDDSGAVSHLLTSDGTFERGRGLGMGPDSDFSGGAGAGADRARDDPRRDGRGAAVAWAPRKYVRSRGGSRRSRAGHMVRVAHRRVQHGCGAGAGDDRASVSGPGVDRAGRGGGAVVPAGAVRGAGFGDGTAGGSSSWPRAGPCTRRCC